MLCAGGAPAGDDAFAGRYGHGHTGEPVWIVARDGDGDGYRVTYAADGSHAPASTGWPAMPVAGSTTIPRSA